MAAVPKKKTILLSANPTPSAIPSSNNISRNPPSLWQKWMDIDAMNSDENAKDPASKETQEFDAALLDEEGIHLEAALDPESTVLEQEQREEGEPDHGAGWHPFKSP
jgi:hypothetical protein